MRKYSTALLALILLIGSSCKKEDLITDFDSLTQGSYLTLTEVVNTNINYASLSTSTVSIKVGSKGSPVDKVNIYVAETPTVDKTQWKLVKSLPFSEGMSLDVKATEIASALGVAPSQLEPGNQYTLYNEIVTKDGRMFSSANTDADFEGQAGYNMAMHWTATVVCPYTASTIAGTYTVVTDQWVDWNPGDQVQVTAGPGANQVNLSQVWPNPAFGSVTNPLVLNVSPATGAVTVPAGVTIAHYTGSGGYDLVTGAGSSGYVFSCTNTISVNIHLTSPQFGDFGNNQLTLKK